MATTTNRAANGRADGLSTADIDAIRSSLAAGRKPKVTFTASAGQIAGQVGQVVQLTDPEQSDEWLVVRFGRDELPFSPADLAVPPRGKPAKPAGSATAGPAAASPVKAGPANASPANASPANASSANASSANASPSKASPSKASPSKASPAKPAAPPAGESAPPPVPSPRGAAAPGADAAEPRRPAKRAAKSARGAKPKPPASMTVTIAYEAGEWTVAAHQGSKTLAKPYLIRPTEALRMVAMLDVPGVHEAVEQIVTAELTEAQRRAETLRSELAEVEARLAELRDVG